MTAQRQANSIVKTGFLLSNNKRIGMNSNLKIVVGSLPLEMPKIKEQTIAPKSQEIPKEEPAPTAVEHSSKEVKPEIIVEETPTEEPVQPEAPKKSYDEVVEYFWRELFGQVYSSWETLPQEAKQDFFTSVEIDHLSDQEVQELFTIRHENNIEAFKAKLDEFRELARK